VRRVGLIFIGFLAGSLSVGAIALYLYNLDTHKITEVTELIQQHFVQDIPERYLCEGAIEGMLKELDPYCSYFTPREFEVFSEEIQGRYVGIGVMLQKDQISGWINVITPLEGTPASREGILPGDKIIQIEGVSTLGMGFEEAAQLLRGTPGTKVRLKLLRSKDKAIHLTLTRAEIQLAMVRYKRLQDGIVYIRVTSFTKEVAQRFEEVIARLTKGPRIKGLILDLRFNPGGLLRSAVRIADMFLNRGIIAWIKGRRREHCKIIRADPAQLLPSSIPMVTLINKGTASAAEILAAALKDNERSILVGMPSFGKGTVQTTFLLSDKSVVRLTTGYYCTPRGKRFGRGKGIQPDEVVPLSEQQDMELIKRFPGITDELDRLDFDPQLQKALQIIRVE
jgi:carboxyl-terminal processing protease